MKNIFNRRDFIRTTTGVAVGLGLSTNLTNVLAAEPSMLGKRVGIIGLDTSHAVAFAKTLNKADAGKEYLGYKVVAAYPQGSKDIQSSIDRVAGYTEEIKTLGVKIVSSIQDLLDQVDVVLLESNDGRVHLEQALPVLKAGKRMFIDKPIAGSLADTLAIFDAAKKHDVPIFSSSSLRYMDSAQEVAKGKVGKVLGADTYSPAAFEKTHPDLLWYGIHGIETLFTVMGKGCETISRTSTQEADVVVGTWKDGRIGTFRGMRVGKSGYGGTVYGEKGVSVLGPFGGYNPLLIQIVEFFETGISPIDPQETIEIVAFSEAADISKKNKGMLVNIQELIKSEKIKVNR